MSKIRVLSDHIANQIAAGEVVERPASVAKELVENSIDAGARRIEVEVEAGGRRLLRVSDDGEGMTHDDAVLAFERHATSKIVSTEDLTRIGTLGFRGEALASIASVARVELVTRMEGVDAATRVVIEGGRMRDVAPAARPRGTTISVGDLFFNVPARRKFLRSEATESYHLTNLVTHYALAHPEISFVLSNNGRETLRAAPAADLRERAYQIFGAEFIDNLLEVRGGIEQLALVGGYVSAPRERRTSRDAQYLFVNGRYVRDRLVSRALSEGYRSVLPQGSYPAALLFLRVPLEEVDVNVHPAKTEVRFRRAAAVADAVREAVRGALAAGGYIGNAPTVAGYDERAGMLRSEAGATEHEFLDDVRRALAANTHASALDSFTRRVSALQSGAEGGRAGQQQSEREGAPSQGSIEFDPAELARERDASTHTGPATTPQQFDAAGSPPGQTPTRGAVSDFRAEDFRAAARPEERVEADESARAHRTAPAAPTESQQASEATSSLGARSEPAAMSSFPPLGSAAGLVREVPVEVLSSDIRPLGQLGDSFIIATDSEGLLLIDQHVAHERILFDKYLALETERRAESQNLLVPETFDLTPAQATAFDTVAEELESYGFELMRLSGRTVAIRAVPADLPSGDARSMLSEILDTVEVERRGTARADLRRRVAATLACRAAVKTNTPLTPEKMRWLIDRLLSTTSPTTRPNGRPVILRLARRDIERGFQRT